jgi:nucleoside-diphosphate-sugar epimerase
MRVRATGSAGHLGEALAHTLRERNYDVVGVDIIDGPFTTRVGSVTDRYLPIGIMRGNA